MDGLDIMNGSALQQYVLLSKNSKGKAVVAVLQRALNDPSTYVFGELCELPSVQQLGETADKQWLELLKIFCYGTYPDYVARQQDLPPLTDQQAVKLRKLTLVSLSSESKVINYDVLLTKLALDNVRQLEDLIIECVNDGVVLGKIDQKHKQFEVDFAIGRDLRPGQLEELVHQLAGWRSTTTQLLTSIDKKVAHTAAVQERNAADKEDYERRLADGKKQTQRLDSANLLDVGGGGMFSDEMDMGGMRRKSARSKRGRSGRKPMMAPSGRDRQW